MGWPVAFSSTDIVPPELPLVQEPPIKHCCRYSLLLSTLSEECIQRRKALILRMELWSGTLYSTAIIDGLSTQGPRRLAMDPSVAGERCRVKVAFSLLNIINRELLQLRHTALRSHRRRSVQLIAECSRKLDAVALRHGADGEEVYSPWIQEEIARVSSTLHAVLSQPPRETRDGVLMCSPGSSLPLPPPVPAFSEPLSPHRAHSKYLEDRARQALLELRASAMRVGANLLPRHTCTPSRAPNHTPNRSSSPLHNADTCRSSTTLIPLSDRLPPHPKTPKGSAQELLELRLVDTVLGVLTPLLPAGCRPHRCRAQSRISAGS